MFLRSLNVSVALFVRVSERLLHPRSRDKTPRNGGTPPNDLLTVSCQKVGSRGPADSCSSSSKSIRLQIREITMFETIGIPWIFGKSRVFDFKLSYLEAPMELERVLGL